MNRKRLSQTLLGACLGLAILLTLVWEFVPLADASSRVQELITQPGKTRVRALPHSETEKDILGKALVTKNVYQVGREQFLVIVLDGTTNRQAVHDPKHCFHSGGWTVGDDTAYPLAKGTGSQLEIKKPDRTTEVLYWFSDSREQHASPVRYWLKATWRRLTLGLGGDTQVLVLVQKLSPAERTEWTTLFDALPALNQL